jgi:glycosyltransferase involved in cell wall biosynthesis
VASEGVQTEVVSSIPAPLVSVIVPAFNAARVLERSVASATGQTLRDLEVVIVDDGSTDHTLEVALELAHTDSRLHVYHEAQNRGAGAARNRARRLARGTWIAGLDADDAWLPNRLQALLSTPGAEHADVIADDVLRVDSARAEAWSCLLHRWQAPLRLTGPTWLTAADMVKHHLGVLQPLVRRDFVNEKGIAEDESLILAEDFYFNLDLLLAGARWLQVANAYYLYFAQGDSMSTRLVRHGQQLLDRHVALGRDPRITAKSDLSAIVNKYIAEEQASVQVERARAILANPVGLVRDPLTLFRLWGGARLSTAMLANTARRARARLARRHARLTFVREVPASVMLLPQNTRQGCIIGGTVG